MARLLQGKGWVAGADRFLMRAATQIRLLAAVTPTNARSEYERLVRAYEGGEIATPNWCYPSVDLGELAGALFAAAREIEQTEEPIAAIYAERAREMANEAELASSVGHPRFALLAAARFARCNEESAAAERCEAWLAAPEAPVQIESSFLPPHALEEAMKKAVGELRLPFTVTRDANMHALAATGENTIYVSAHARVTERDIARTVIHETIGHALPRHRAASQPFGIFRIGTANGADEQEGFALVVEERNEMLDAGRKRELALRHLAACQMENGAAFADVATLLIKNGASPRIAVAIASRVFRGSQGNTRGLGRERTYLEAYIRVEKALRADPSCERVLHSGQVSVHALSVVRELVVDVHCAAESASR